VAAIARLPVKVPGALHTKLVKPFVAVVNKAAGRCKKLKPLQVGAVSLLGGLEIYALIRKRREALHNDAASPTAVSSIWDRIRSIEIDVKK